MFCGCEWWFTCLILCVLLYVGLFVIACGLSVVAVECFDLIVLVSSFLYFDFITWWLVVLVIVVWFRL